MSKFLRSCDFGLAVGWFLAATALIPAIGGSAFAADPIRIGNVAALVGESELLRFDLDVKRVGAQRVHGGQREMLHDVEHLKRADALTVGRELINRPIAIGRRNGVDPF